MFGHGRALRLIVSVFQWDLRPVIFLSRIIALCGKCFFFWLSTPTHTTLCEQALILLFFCNIPTSGTKYTKDIYFPLRHLRATQERCCVALGGRGGLFSSRFTCFSFSRPTKTDKSPKILEANKQEVPAGGISAVLSPFQLVKQSSWVN